MIDFQPINLKDKNVINQFLTKNTYRNCDFSFSNIFCWKHRYQTTYHIEGNVLYFRFYAGGKKAGYMFPLGDGNMKDAMELIMADSKERNEPFRIYALTREMYNQIEDIFPGKFNYQTKSSWFEYIYDSEDLITLKGKKFQPKRNHINKFRRTYSDFEYLPITREIIPECLALYNLWYEENNSDASLADEQICTEVAFNNFEELDLKGGALRVNGKIVAYSYGQPLSQDTFGVHAEKSLYEIDGGFTMINQQFAEHECSGYKYINREEDLGLESLRQAKMSYHPVIWLEKGFITLNE